MIFVVSSAFTLGEVALVIVCFVNRALAANDETQVSRTHEFCK